MNLFLEGIPPRRKLYIYFHTMELLERSGAHILGSLTREKQHFGPFWGNEEDRWTIKTCMFDTFWGAQCLAHFILKLWKITIQSKMWPQSDLTLCISSPLPQTPSRPPYAPRSDGIPQPIG